MAFQGKEDELFPFHLEVEGLEEAAKREEDKAMKGSYGYVFKVDVKGVVCVAKKLHSAFIRESRVSLAERQTITSKFRNECVILSKLRHPNIVQFVGVHYGRRENDDLSLVMESVRCDLDDFLSEHPNVPLSLKLSILLDVSYGLVYLHEYNPPIVHRDLTARNILVTDSCQAKIADLGVAKIVSLKEQLVKSHTKVPGQQFYMPPEAFMDRAECTPKLDIFSFGHLSLFTLNQAYPEVVDLNEFIQLQFITQIADLKEEGTMEKERRAKSLQTVGSDHCLYSIITECLYDRPDQRPTTRDLNRQLIQLSAQHPVSMAKVMPLMGEDLPKDLSRLAEQNRVNQLKLEETNRKLSVLNEECDHLKLAKTQLESEKAKLKSELDELLEQDSDLRKKMEVLREELDEQQRESEKLARAVQQTAEKLKKSEEMVRHLEQKTLLQASIITNTQQELSNSQQVATALSSKLGSQAVEIVELKQSKEELMGELEAQRFTANTFREDFEAERKDREKAHSLITEVKTQYAHQFYKMGEELGSTQKQLAALQDQYSKLKAREKRGHVKGGWGPEGGGASEADKKKVNELMKEVQYLHTKNALLQSQLAQLESKHYSNPPRLTNATPRTQGGVAPTRPIHSDNMGVVSSAGGPAYSGLSMSQSGGGTNAATPAYLRPGYMSMGSSSLPKNIGSPEQPRGGGADPHFRGGSYGQAEPHSHDDMDLRGQAETVENNSPPTSFLSLSLGPSHSSGGPTHFNGGFASLNRSNIGSTPRQQQDTGNGWGGSLKHRQYHPTAIVGTTFEGAKFGQGYDSRVTLFHEHPIQEVDPPTSGSSHVPFVNDDSSKTVNTSTSVSSVKDNRFEEGLDKEIGSVADTIKMRVGGGAGLEEEELPPYDPNLVCPTCGRRFRLGQIQVFRLHAAKCTNAVT